MCDVIFVVVKIIWFVIFLVNVVFWIIVILCKICNIIKNFKKVFLNLKY